MGKSREQFCRRHGRDQHRIRVQMSTVRSKTLSGYTNPLLRTATSEIQPYPPTRRSLVPSSPPALPSEPLLTGLGHLGRGLPLGRRKGLGGKRIRVIGRFHFCGELGEHRLHAFGLLGQGREILGLIGI